MLGTTKTKRFSVIVDCVKLKPPGGARGGRAVKIKYSRWSKLRRLTKNQNPVLCPFFPFLTQSEKKFSPGFHIPSVDHVLRWDSDPGTRGDCGTAFGG